MTALVKYASDCSYCGWEHPTRFRQSSCQTCGRPTCVDHNVTPMCEGCKTEVYIPMSSRFNSRRNRDVCWMCQGEKRIRWCHEHGLPVFAHKKRSDCAFTYVGCPDCGLKRRNSISRRNPVEHELEMIIDNDRDNYHTKMSICIHLKYIVWLRNLSYHITK